MLNRKIVLVLAPLSILECVSACSSVMEKERDDAGLEGYYLSSTLWTKKDIPVCWENTNTSQTEREWVQDAVQSQYGNKTSLNFKDWKSCTDAPNSDIRIQVADVGPHTIGLGRQIGRRSNGMVLNFSFQNWSKSCQQHRQSCIESIAVHEFGHAAGLAHEQNRSDRPDACTEPAQGGNGDVRVGFFDNSSVMNYCNPVYNNNGELSSGDVATLNHAYAFLQ